MDTSIVAISGLPTSSKSLTPQLNGFIGTGVEPKTPKPPTNGFVVKAVISNVINVNTSDNVPNTPSGGSSRTEQCAKDNALTVPSDSPSTSLGVGDTNNNVGDGDGSTVEKKERKYRPRRRRFRRKMATNLPPCVISNRDPVSVLMEHGQTREVTVDFTECTRTGPAHNSRFHTAALVNGKRFAEGHGTSKKNAKKIAAELALDRLYKVASRNLASANEIVADRIENNEDENANDEPLSPAQKIKAMAKGVFELAEETQMIYYCKEKVVASFLMERCGQITVVALGTGNRSVLYQNLKTDGTCILQAHAEIVARRAFIRFLYNELSRFIDGESDAIFTLGTSGRLQLLDSVKFHLYISRPPCGDASAFPTIGSKDVRSKALRKQGVLRTLVADGEGAIPTDSVLPAGHNGEERLRVMTCSDKICRWNVVGVQGALLSHIIEPIYLSKVVIGSYSGDQKEHVPRALFGRLQTGTLEEKIYNPYVVNVPSLYYPEDHDLDNYALNKSRQYSVVWTLGDDGVEVIDGIFGIKISGPTDMPYSAVSKKHFFTLFHELCQKFGRRDLLGKSYLQIKDKASEYRRNQDVLYQHFVSKKLGTWCSVSENYDVDNFYL